jgi:WD40 repeat protein
VYPSSLVHATKATLGGGSNAVVKIASATMYHEELSKSVVETIGLQGPSACLFQRFLAVPSGATAQHMADLRESVVPSPFSGPTDAAVSRMGAFSKLQVVFSFHARDEISGHDDAYADRSVEWISEGVTGAHGKWLSLEHVQATSEIQQRNARLGKNVFKGTVARREVKAAWGRLLGVDAVPVLLDYLLNATEILMKEFSAVDDNQTIAILQTTAESLTTDMLCIFRGLLLNHATNIHQALKTFVPHQFYYVVRKHPTVIQSAWTPTNIVACVNMVSSMLKITPSSLSAEEERSPNHPTQLSVWAWNPIFASAVRAWLLDFRVWTKLSFKTQSIYNHQLYRLACEHPKLLNDLNIVPRLLEMLQLYFDASKSHGHLNKDIDKADGGSVSAQNSKYSAGADKEQHWKQQCIQTIMETLEVCLVNQSVHVHAALMQEVLETTFARAAVTANTPSAASPSGPSASVTSTAELPGLASGVAFSQQRKGGVFFVNLENIIWSDQASTTSSSSASEHYRGGPLDSDDKQDGGVSSATSAALPHVQIRFSLLRDLRAVVRFVVTCEDPHVLTALLQLVRRLSVAYLDLRFGFISSNIVDAVLRVLSVFARPPQSVRRDKERRNESVAQAAEVRMACVPLLIYYLEWLESVEGRTVWCGLEEHLRSVLNGDGTYTRGFLELMMEFYFDPIGRCGVQQSIVMNDPSKKDSILFPLSPMHSSKTPNSSIHDTGIAVMSDDGFRTDGVDAISSGSGGLSAWIKLATTFCGRKLSLSWEKRVQIVRMAALRSLSHTTHIGTGQPSPNGGKRSPLRHTQSEGGDHSPLEEVMRVYDKGVSDILSLPLKSILPFLPALLVNTTVHMRDRVLMEISVKLKTDDANQDHQILMMKRDWIEALLELCVVCNNGSQQAELLGSVDTTTPPDVNERRRAYRSTAYSFDAHKTGEDLVVDLMVSLLCSAMQHPSGWRAFIDLIAALKVMQRKYSPQQSTGDAESASYIPPVLPDLNNATNDLLLLAHPLDWLSHITGIVLQKMARSRTILSKVLTENVRKILVLVQEALLSTAHQHCPALALAEGNPAIPQRASGRYVWSEAQVLLLTAVLDMSTRLVDSTHKAYRGGLVPGLQVLQASLSYVPADGAALVARITQTMERAFQQELNTASAVRVFDHMTPREVFLSALVCLRRALLVQQGNGNGGESELCEALQMLILKLCTSEIFLEDLHNSGLTVHDLSEMSEESAVVAVLDALGAVMNDAEMHEREEQADLVPLFPDAKELRRLDEDERGGISGQEDHDIDPDPFAIAFASTSSAAADPEPPSVVTAFDDQMERSVWAALEVEENRMLESLKDVAQREVKRQDRIREVIVPDRDTWTARLWDVQEFKFRSQHARSLLSREVSASIMKEFARRVGLYESPVPGRLRKPLDPDFPMTDRCLTPVEEHDLPQLHASDSMRRRFSLPLEMHGLSDTKLAAMDETETASEDEAHRLLERVGRVVAAQGGGEIQDITTERVVHLESGVAPSLDGDGGGGGPNQTVGEEVPDSPTKSEQEPHSVLEDNDDQQEQAEEESKPSSLPAPSLPSGLWHVDTERHNESGLDPSEGMALAPGEEIVAQATCRRVLPEGMVHGQLYFCAKVLVFVPLTSAELDALGTPSANDEVAPGLRRCWRWKYKHVAAVFLRRFRLRDSALELFFQNGSTHFLDFPHVVKQQRNELVRLLYSFLPRSVLKQWPGRAAMSSTNLSSTTKAWQNRQISNYEYLMALNTYAGRSFNDLTQYPVFPWVVRDYESPVLDLNDTETFRDLSKPMGALNPDRLQEFWERYNSFDDPVIPKFLYGSHYSTCAGVVLFFLVRMQPFAQLHKKMQGGTFDLPDRLFYSIQETWHMCNSQMSEVKELTPEFYSDPSFLTNGNSFAFGKRHDHVPVHDVVLPKWANGSPQEFVRLHRAALESEYVSEHLHEWVDLIFGFKQRGKAALKANNVFYYLTYYGVVDLDRIEDPFIRESMELQIAHFGQCPMQLFSSPHPKRNQTTRRVPGLGPNGAAGTSASGPAPGVGSATPAPQATLASPSVRSPVAPSPAATTMAGTSLIKPLSWMFQDISPTAQEHRRQWSPTLVVQPFAASAVRWIKIYPDRFLTVNELGVVELYYWKLSPKPLPLPSETPPTGSTNAADDVLVLEGPGTPAPLPAVPSDYEEPEIPLISVTVRTTSDDSATSPPVELASEDADAEHLLPSGPTCPWLIEVARDDSPFDAVPRIPVFEDTASKTSDAFFPITASLNGRVLISGGAPNGSIQLRLLDLDNGHVIAKASVTGHDAAVTCLSVDRFSYHNAPVGSHHQSDGDELLVSGAKDATLAVWRLSRTKPDLLFRPPRVSTCPLMVLRGHKLPLVDCTVNTYLNVVASCSTDEALVHFLHDDGAVAFGLSAADVHHDSAFVGIAASSKGFIVVLARWVDRATASTSSACIVVNLAGVILLKQVFEDENVSRLQLSSEGDLVILTIAEQGIIRLCRLDEYVVCLSCSCSITVADFTLPIALPLYKSTRPRPTSTRRFAWHRLDQTKPRSSPSRATPTAPW